MDDLQGTPPPLGFDDALATAPVSEPQLQSDSPPEGFDDALETLQQEKYGTGLGQAQAAAHGVVKGLLGPVGTGLERYVAKVHPETLKGVEEANPITTGVSEAAGLGLGMLTGTGEAAVMSKAGEAAQVAAGLEHVTQASPILHRIGSEAVKQAAEMAIFQSGDEVSKMIMQDPETSAESAIANVGLASALGAGGGAFMAGIASPLWKATSKPLEDALLGIHARLGGNAPAVMPEAVESAFKELGHEPPPLIRAALSGDEKALSQFQDLYRGEHPEVMAAIKDIPAKVEQAVVDKLGVGLEDAQVFSNERSGEAIRKKTIEMLEKDYGPIHEEQQAKEAALHSVKDPDENRLNLYDRIFERAVGEHVGTDADVYPLYAKYAEKVLSRETLGGMNKLSSDLGKLASHHTTDPLSAQAYRDIKTLIDHHVENALDKQAIHATTEGLKEGSELIAQRRTANANYKEYVKKFEGLMDAIGVGDWKGTGSLKSKLENLSAEQLLKKFSTKGDVASQRFLTENLPEVAKMVREHEAKAFLSPSIKEVAGETTIDVKNLAKRLEALKKGSPEHADWVMSPDAQRAIEAGKVINDAMTGAKAVRNSGTPAGMMKLMRHFGTSALGAVGMLAGHNPISGLVLGELAHKIGKEAPEAIKLASLKFIGSGQPVKAEGFKAMATWANNVIKGETMLQKGAKAVFTPGVRVMAESQMPVQADRDRLDKTVERFQNAPDTPLHLADESHLGHYMPEHQVALTQSQMRAVEYLKSVKPQPHKFGVLDTEVPPTPAEVARYNRALDIATSPAIVYQHIKDGTLQKSDIQDLQHMYPALYKNMATKLTREVGTIKADEAPVPYRTKVSVSMFMGQPLDASMTPEAIQAAQPIAQQPPAPASTGGKINAKASTTMNKNAQSYRTPGQAAQADRSNRD